MDSIYYAVKAVAAIWVLMTFMIYLFGGSRPEKNDRFSFFFIMITITFVLPTIQATVAAGVTGPGAFSWGFPLVSYAGFFVFLFGLVIHWIGIITLNKQWSTVVVISKDHKLIDTGIYRTIRHPIYAGVLLEILAMGLALSNWIAILALVIPNAVAFAYRMHVEERALGQYFGEAYVQYSRKTSRLIPWIF
jgi:protein-S-isoprenylcysteine O-methyltransferase Ste14